MKKAVEIKNGIFWAGSLDYDIRVFDIIMRTEYGTTYNSYVVKGSRKTALIEISKEGFFDEFLERFSSVSKLSEIDYVIVNHTEPDHTGSLAKLIGLNPEIEVIGSAQAIKYIRDIVNLPMKTRIVKDGDTLDLGGKTLKFIMAPFLHWPDTMWTYDAEDAVLFTCDAFGCHYCSEGVFNDSQKNPDSFMDAYKYYFDTIMGPFKPFVLSALGKIAGLKLETICTGHGPVIRTDIPKYIDLYREWAAVKKPEKPYVVMAYVSAYGYTKKLAMEIGKGVKSTGADVYCYDLVDDKVMDAVDKIADASGLLIGSPTIVADTLPPIWELLSHINPFIHKGKLVGAFGSYGWSGEAVPNIEERFNQLRLKKPVESLRVIFNPSDEDLKKAYEFGKEFGGCVMSGIKYI